jgi:RNA polymerase sigma-70 factor (ECF subfamily)
VSRQGADTGLRAALAELLPELRAFARFLAGTKAEADDLVQEALARTLQTINGDGEISELKPWCFAVLRNVFHEQSRARRREQLRLKRQIAEDAVPAAQEASSDVQDLAQKLRALSPLLREALVLVGAQGLSYDEAARVCGVPPGTMKARVSRARHQLALALDRVNASRIHDATNEPCRSGPSDS